MRNIVIIGNGISGITCARHIRKKCNDPITIISSESEHFYSRTALMYVYMGHMKYDHIKPYEDFFWKKNKLQLVFDHVEEVDTKGRKLTGRSGNVFTFDVLVIAAGSKSRTFECAGSDLPGVSGLYNLQDLEKIQKQTKNISHAVVVGGGLIGVELAEMFHSRKIEVTMLVRDNAYWGSVLPHPDATLVGNHIQHHGIKVMYETELKQIIGKEGRVTQIETKSGSFIKCDFVGISTGVSPNIDFIKASGIECKTGVLVNNFFETNVEGVYAIGDCAEFRETISERKKIEQIWYTGRMHGETLAETICGKRTEYVPGPFFNSAKFFDLEYQTYGSVPPRAGSEELFYTWKHPSKEIQLTIVSDKTTKIFKGVNCFGTRLRHEVFDKWIREKKTVDHVVSDFGRAVFDKEFEKNYVDLLIEDYNIKNDTQLENKRASFFKPSNSL